VAGLEWHHLHLSTGYDRDATDGVQSVRAVGGGVIAQDEATCASFGMPKSAYVPALPEIAPALMRMAVSSGEDGDASSPMSLSKRG
jgi:chemotaxis response regulator CheB